MEKQSSFIPTRTLSITPGNAAKEAMTRMETHKYFYYRTGITFCLEFVEDVYGISQENRDRCRNFTDDNDWYAKQVEKVLLIPNTENDFNPPPGALIFYDYVGTFDGVKKIGGMLESLQVKVR